MRANYCLITVAQGQWNLFDGKLSQGEKANILSIQFIQLINCDLHQFSWICRRFTGSVTSNAYPIPVPTDILNSLVSAKLYTFFTGTFQLLSLSFANRLDCLFSFVFYVRVIVLLKFVKITIRKFHFSIQRTDDALSNCRDNFNWKLLLYCANTLWRCTS